MRDYHIPTSMAVPVAIGVAGVLWYLRRKSDISEQALGPTSDSTSQPDMNEITEEISNTEQDGELLHCTENGFIDSHRKIPRNLNHDPGGFLKDSDPCGLETAEKFGVKSSLENFGHEGQEFPVKEAWVRFDYDSELTWSHIEFIEHLAMTVMVEGMQEAVWKLSCSDSHSVLSNLRLSGREDSCVLAGRDNHATSIQEFGHQFMGDNVEDLVPKIEKYHHHVVSIQELGHLVGGDSAISVEDLVLNLEGNDHYVASIKEFKHLGRADYAEGDIKDMRCGGKGSNTTSSEHIRRGDDHTFRVQDLEILSRDNHSASAKDFEQLSGGCSAANAYYSEKVFSPCTKVHVTTRTTQTHAEHLTESSFKVIHATQYLSDKSSSKVHKSHMQPNELSPKVHKSHVQSNKLFLKVHESDFQPDKTSSKVHESHIQPDEFISKVHESNVQLDSKIHKSRIQPDKSSLKTHISHTLPIDPNSTGRNPQEAYQMPQVTTTATSNSDKFQSSLQEYLPGKQEATASSIPNSERTKKEKVDVQTQDPMFSSPQLDPVRKADNSTQDLCLQTQIPMFNKSKIRTPRISQPSTQEMDNKAWVPLSGVMQHYVMSVEPVPIELDAEIIHTVADIPSTRPDCNNIVQEDTSVLEDSQLAMSSHSPGSGNSHFENNSDCAGNIKSRVEDHSHSVKSQVENHSDCAGYITSHAENHSNCEEYINSQAVNYCDCARYVTSHVENHSDCAKCIKSQVEDHSHSVKSQIENHSDFEANMQAHVKEKVYYAENQKLNIEEDQLNFVGKMHSHYEDQFYCKENMQSNIEDHFSHAKVEIKQSGFEESNCAKNLNSDFEYQYDYEQTIESIDQYDHEENIEPLTEDQIDPSENIQSGFKEQFNCSENVQSGQYGHEEILESHIEDRYVGGDNIELHTEDQYEGEYPSETIRSGFQEKPNCDKSVQSDFEDRYDYEKNIESHMEYQYGCEENTEVHTEDQCDHEQNLELHSEDQYNHEENLELHADGQHECEENIESHTEDQFYGEENLEMHAEDQYGCEENTELHTENQYGHEENIELHTEDQYDSEENIESHTEDQFDCTENMQSSFEEKFKFAENVRSYSEDHSDYDATSKSHYDCRNDCPTETDHDCSESYECETGHLENCSKSCYNSETDCQENCNKQHYSSETNCPEISRNSIYDSEADCQEISRKSHIDRETDCPENSSKRHHGSKTDCPESSRKSHYDTETDCHESLQLCLEESHTRVQTRTGGMSVLTEAVPCKSHLRSTSDIARDEHHAEIVECCRCTISDKYDADETKDFEGGHTSEPATKTKPLPLTASSSIKLLPSEDPPITSSEASTCSINQDMVKTSSNQDGQIMQNVKRHGNRPKFSSGHNDKTMTVTTIVKEDSSPLKSQANRGNTIVKESSPPKSQAMSSTTIVKEKSNPLRSQTTTGTTVVKEENIPLKSQANACTTDVKEESNPLKSQATAGATVVKEESNPLKSQTTTGTTFVKKESNPLKSQAPSIKRMEKIPPEPNTSRLLKVSTSSVSSLSPEEIDSLWGINCAPDIQDTELPLTGDISADSSNGSHCLPSEAAAPHHSLASQKHILEVTNMFSEVQVIAQGRPGDENFGNVAYYDKGIFEDPVDMLHSPIYDYNSEGSNDSGRGGSDHDNTCHGHEELQRFDFNIPADLCGLLIGKQGKNISKLASKTGAHVTIVNSPYATDYQVCQVTGAQAEVNDALAMIRRRFPLQDYPKLTMAPVDTQAPPPPPPPPPLMVESCQQYVVPDIMQLNLPRGVSVEVYVTAIIHAGHLFVRHADLESVQALEGLTYNLNLSYSQYNCTPGLPSPVQPGSVCVYESDGCWYRVMTISTENMNRLVHVKFLDYGGYATVPTIALRQIRTDFMSLPFQAVECFMANITPNHYERFFSREAAMALSEMTMGKLLRCQVVAHNEYGVPCIHLYQISSRNNCAVLINRALVKKRLVSWLEILRF